MSSDQTNLTISLIILFLSLVLAIITIASHWKIFEKADQKGWKSIVPFYNVYILFEIAGYNGWWFLTLLIPGLNIIAILVLALRIAQSFGKSMTFGIFANWIFSPIGYWIIGFGDSKYKKLPN